MTKSHNFTSECFSGILRRLLCTGNPSDLITDPTTTIPTTTFENPKK
ncbi:hypothetical protein CsSME_00038873 [Camellia sinensis var. sinensis]